MRYVQLFTKGEHSCEINEVLLATDYRKHGVELTTKEGESISTHFFPYWNISMIRFWEEK